VELRSHKIDDDVTKKGETNLAMRTKLFLTSIATLFLATGAAHATGPDDCAVVVQTRDGFLNVREAPTMKSKIIAKLHPMDGRMPMSAL